MFFLKIDNNVYPHPKHLQPKQSAKHQSYLVVDFRASFITNVNILYLKQDGRIFRISLIKSFLIRSGAVRNADRIWVSTPQNRTYRDWVKSDQSMEN